MIEITGKDFFDENALRIIHHEQEHHPCGLRRDLRGIFPKSTHELQGGEGCSGGPGEGLKELGRDLQK